MLSSKGVMLNFLEYLGILSTIHLDWCKIVTHPEADLDIDTMESNIEKNL